MPNYVLSVSLCNTCVMCYRCIHVLHVCGVCNTKQVYEYVYYRCDVLQVYGVSVTDACYTSVVCVTGVLCILQVCGV